MWHYPRTCWLGVLACCVLIPAPCSAETGEVIIKGVDGAAADNVKAYLSIDDEPCDAPQWRIQGRFKRADEEIRKALQAFGYYQPKIDKHLGAEDQCWQATFTIEPGQRVKLRKVDIQIQGPAKDDPPFGKRLKRDPMKPGQALRQDRYEDLKRDLQNLAVERGYLRGQFTRHELRVNPKAGYADIILHYDSGPRFRFGSTTIQQDILNPKLVRRFIAYEEGEPYDSAKIAKTHQALTNSGYFSQVIVRPELDGAQDEAVPTRLELAPTKRRRYSGGVGFATDVGPRLSLEYQDKRVNWRGHRFRANLRLSPVLSELTLGYRIPLRDPSKEFLSFDGGFQHEDTDTSRSDTFKLSASRTLKRAHAWLERQFIEFIREDFAVAGESTISVLLTPGITWSKVVTHNHLYPRNGYRVSLETRGALKALASEVDVIQFVARAKKITGLPWRSRLIARADLGASILDEFALLPSSLRFFAGGDNSVRGYAFESLGPRNARGDVLGGRNLIVGSLEIDHLLTEKWGVAAFVDSGNAFNDTNIDLETGTGLGLRWRSPIGPVRLDLALALDKRGDPIRFHVSIGPDL